MKLSTDISRVLPFKDWDNTVTGETNVVTLLDAKASDRVLIIGCADGRLGRLIKSKGCTIIGVDSNVSILESARNNGIDARLMNGESLIFKEEFDAVVSYSALQWMRHPDKVIAGVWNALKPNGRFVGETGAYQNLDKVVSVFLNALKKRGIDGFYLIPWYFPSVDDYNFRLEKAGFFVENLEEIKIEQALDIPLSEWVQGRVGEAFSSVLKESERISFYQEVEKELIARLKNYGDGPILEYRILRFKAVKPDGAKIGK